MTVLMNKHKLYLVMNSIIVFMLCINVDFINQRLHLNSKVMLLMRVTYIILLIVIKVKRIDLFGREFLIINSWFFIVIFSSILNGRDLVYAINNLTRSYLICLFSASYFFHKDRFMTVLETWKNILILYCLLDLASMIMFPQGLYMRNTYVCWFLGYKTARVVLSHTLMILVSYLSYYYQKRISLSTCLIYLLSIVTAFYSGATAGGWGLVSYMVLMILVVIMTGKSSKSHLLYKVFNYKSIISIYGFMFILVTVVQSNEMIQYLVQNVFKKSSNLSSRTIIWAQSFIFFRAKPLLGHGYLTTQEYVVLTGFPLGASPHNFVLSILLTSGLVGLIIYLIMFSAVLIRPKKFFTYQEFTLIIGIISSLIIGLTSSVMVFSTFAYLPFVILAFNMKEGRLADNKVDQRKEKWCLFTKPRLKYEIKKVYKKENTVL